MVKDASAEHRKEFSASELTIGIKCGASDTTSGIVSNPATGVAADRIIGCGGRVIFGETTEIIGAEHILGKRAANKKVSDSLYEIVSRMEKEGNRMRVNIRGSQPRLKTSEEDFRASRRNRLVHYIRQAVRHWST